jgi:hypothetical protein
MKKWLFFAYAFAFKYARPGRNPPSSLISYTIKTSSNQTIFTSLHSTFIKESIYIKSTRAKIVVAVLSRRDMFSDFIGSRQVRVSL